MSYFCKYKVVSQKFRHPTFESVTKFREWVKKQDAANEENWVEGGSLPKEFIYTKFTDSGDYFSFDLEGIGWLGLDCEYPRNELTKEHPTHCNSDGGKTWNEKLDLGIKSFAPPDSLEYFESLAKWFDFVFFVTGEQHPWVSVNHYLIEEKELIDNVNMWLIEAKDGEVKLHYLKFAEVRGH